MKRKWTIDICYDTNIEGDDMPPGEIGFVATVTDLDADPIRLMRVATRESCSNPEGLNVDEFVAGLICLIGFLKDSPLRDKLIYKDLLGL